MNWDWEEFLFGEPRPWARYTLAFLQVAMRLFAFGLILYMFYCFCGKVGETLTKIDEIHKAVVTK